MIETRNPVRLLNVDVQFPLEERHLAPVSRHRLGGGRAIGHKLERNKQLACDEMTLWCLLLLLVSRRVSSSRAARRLGVKGLQVGRRVRVVGFVGREAALRLLNLKLATWLLRLDRLDWSPRVAATSNQNRPDISPQRQLKWMESWGQSVCLASVTGVCALSCFENNNSPYLTAMGTIEDPSSGCDWT